jgi:hypothetical protein
MSSLGEAQEKARAAKVSRTKARKSTTQDTSAAPSRPDRTTAATFIATDTETRGSWAGIYGNQGYNIISNASSYPDYARVNRSGLAAWTWENPTDDARALEKASSSNRIAAAWYEDDTLTFDLQITDGMRHQVALYMLDWDFGAREQMVEVLDAADGSVLDSRIVSDFTGGQYLAWNISGQVKFRFTRMAGINVILSGIFFDAESASARPTNGPAISGVKASGISSGSAAIAWATNKPADSVVEYGPTVVYGNATTASSPLVTGHQINLTGLVPATLYHYRVLSKDGQGNISASGDFTFATPAALGVGSGPGDPELPREFLDTSFPRVAGGTITVNAGDDLQAALNNATPGDTIILQAGATFAAPSGGFVLPAKSWASGQWIVIRSSGLSSLPEGRRVNPSQAPAMPKIISNDVAPALVTETGASFWWLAGLEVTIADTALANATSPGANTNYGLIRLGSDAETVASRQATDILIDRCYVHGLPTKNVRRGVALNSRRTAIIDSYFADFHEIGADSQAIAGWNGPGPFKIVNNHLEGAGENVMFGGSDSAVANLVPADIEFRHNHLIKPRSWFPTDPSFGGIAWSVKNIFELKNARRVLADGNVFENNWVSAQNGFGILFTVRNQDGGSPWATVEDVTFTNNLVRHTSSAVNVLGQDNLQKSGQSHRLKITNNVFEGVTSTPWGGAGCFLQITDSIDAKVENNTIFHTGNLVTAYPNYNAPSNTGFVFRNNIAANNSGVIGDSTAPGPSSLFAYFPGVIFVGNILAGAPSSYPAGNYFPATLDSVGFVNRAGGDYRLSAGSAFKNTGSDGRDPGADIDALNAATAGVIQE